MNANVLADPSISSRSSSSIDRDAKRRARFRNDLQRCKAIFMGQHRSYRRANQILIGAK